MTCSVEMKCPTLLVTLFFWIIVPDFCRSQQEQFAGPFQLIVKQLDQCDETGTNQISVTSTRISKISRNKFVYSTNMTTDFTIDDSMSGELDIAKFGNGGWRPHFMQMEFPQFCTSMGRMAPGFFSAILDALHTQCPVPPGRYEVKDLDMGQLKIASFMPNFPYGQYRADYNGRVNGTLVGCIRCYVDVVPAKRGRRQKKPKN